MSGLTAAINYDKLHVARLAYEKANTLEAKQRNAGLHARLTTGSLEEREANLLAYAEAEVKAKAKRGEKLIGVGKKKGGSYHAQYMRAKATLGVPGPRAGAGSAVLAAQRRRQEKVGGVAPGEGGAAL
jgi:hypothetical protein